MNSANLLSVFGVSAVEDLASETSRASGRIPVVIFKTFQNASDAVFDPICDIAVAVVDVDVII